MAEVQNMVLEIDKNNYVEADFMSRRFVNAEVRNRAYINVLSAELFIRYLADNGHPTDDIVSMHSISKVLEDIDIADVLLPNVHLDVRAVFDEEKIFVPKSHFALDITPDIYIVLKLSRNLKEAVLLGYFKPSQINKKHENSDYYFISKDRLAAPDTLLKTLSKYKAVKDQRLEPKEFLKGRALSVALSDHDLNNAERKELYRLMLTDSMLRDSIAEFDNFEVLSSQVATVIEERIELKEQAANAVPGIAALTTEEILKEGVEAVINEKTAEANEVFDTVTESTEEVQEIAETTAKVSDVFESAPVDEVPAETNEVQDEKPVPTLEILDSEDNAPQVEEQEQEKAESEQSEITETETVEQEPVMEEELSVGDTEELAIEEDIALPDIDTLETSETEEGAEEISDAKEEPAQEETEVEPETAQETDLEISEPEIAETEPVEQEPVMEEELSVGDTEELAIEEDIALPDIDTLETSETEEGAEEISDAKEEPAQEETEVEPETAPETDLEISEPEIAETEPVEQEPVMEEELSVGDTEELSIEEDIALPDIDTLETSETEEGAEEISDTKEEPAQEETEVEPETAQETDLEISEPEITETETVEQEPVMEEELSVGDTEELAIEEDIVLPDIDTLESAGAQEPVQSVNVNEGQPQPAVSNDTITGYQKPVMDAVMSIDALLDNAIAAIDAKKPEKKDENKQEKSKSEVSDKVSDKAIKMTSVAGGSVDDLIHGADKHAKLNSDNHSVSSASAYPSADGDHMSFIGGLSDLKHQANMLAEAQGLAVTTDMSELDEVEREQQETIVHEVVDMNNIETVEREEYVEDESGIVELGEIKDVDSPTKPAENIEELALQTVETETMELPDLNSYTINEDGTSPLDNMNWGPEEETNPDDLLDLDMAETLIGGAVNMGQTDYTDDLVDGTAFKSADMVFDMNNPQNTSQKEEEENDNNEDNEIFDTLDAGFDEVLPELMPEDSEIISENNIEEMLLDNGEDENVNSEPEETPVDNVESSDDMEEDNSPIEILDAPDEVNMEEEDNTGEENSGNEPPEGELHTEMLEDTMAEPETQSVSENEQDWTEDTGFDTLPDIETPEIVEEDNGDSIVEKAPSAPVYNAVKNSTVISDKTFRPGEINIDINTQTIPHPAQGDDTISSLYEKPSEAATNTILNNPGRLSRPVQKTSGGLAAGLSIAGALVIFVLLFSFGFGISKFLKGPADETPQPISEDGTLSGDYAQQETPAETGQVVEMDNNTNALASTAGTAKPSSASSFVEVKKLSWEVPGTVSADPNFQQYFQSAGKSLKSALMTDLLAVTDKAYASEMRVSVTYNQDGTFRDARIITASGSNQLDNIVLRTVNQTLNVLKAPRSVGSYENTTAVLKIYL